MSKIFLIVLITVVIVWWWRRKRLSSSPPHAPQQRSQAVETMVACAHCGVYLPQGESLADGERRYCCEAHRQLGAP